MIAPTFFQDIYLLAASHYLPGEPIDNEQIDTYVAPLDQNSKRIKQRVLGENGIQTRHYALDTEGRTTISHTELACKAIQQCLSQANIGLDKIAVLASASSGGDVLMPGVANMIQGALHAPPMETHSHHGVCASSIMALKDAAQSLAQNSEQDLAVVVAAEMPSRIFKHTRFTNQKSVDFEAHFLRWMLSDGAGAVLLGKGAQVLKQAASNPLGQRGLALKLNWIHAKSFSGDYPVCMQLGQGSHRATEQNADYSAEASYLDFPSVAAAEAAGHFALRQNLRILPNLFEVAVHEYAGLVQGGWVHPSEVDTFLCHYSSEALGKTCEVMMESAGLGIPREHWFSNLKTCGNTGSASIFIMLSEWLTTQNPQVGQKIFAFVPESGRFTVSYCLLEVVELAAITQQQKPIAASLLAEEQLSADLPSPPASYQPDMHQLVRNTLLELAEIWHQFRSQIWRTPLVEKINAGQLTQSDYLTWMAQWIPQVREGSWWMREAVAQLDESYQALAELMIEHANDEQFDFNILFEDYRAAGGQVASIDHLQRNAGGEALNSYMYRKAKSPNPLGLLGGIYIIEGTGQRIVPWLLPLVKQQLNLPERCYRFLKYHGENDAQHLARWLLALQLVLEFGGEAAQRDIVRTARDVATLYQLQMEHIL